MQKAAVLIHRHLPPIQYALSQRSLIFRTYLMKLKIAQEVVMLAAKAAQQRSLTLEPHILHRSPLLGRLTQSEIGSLFLARHRMTPGLSAARTLLSLCKRQAPTDTLRSKFKLRPRARLGTIKSDALVDHG